MLKKLRIKNRDIYESAYASYEGQELTHNTFKSEVFPLKATQCETLKILTSKKMLWRLPVALAQVKASNTSENLLIKSHKLYVLCNEQKKLLKKYVTI